MVKNLNIGSFKKEIKGLPTSVFSKEINVVSTLLDMENNSLVKDAIFFASIIQLKKSEQYVDVIYPELEIFSLLKLKNWEKIIYQYGSVFDEEDNLVDIFLQIRTSGRRNIRHIHTYRFLIHNAQPAYLINSRP